MLQLPILSLAIVATAIMTGACTAKPKPFSSAVGRFSLEAPVDLTETVRIDDTDSGQVTMHLFEGRGRTHAFVVAYFDEPISEEKYFPGETLDLKRDGALAIIQAKLASERKILLDGHPGREFSATFSSSGQAFGLQERIFLVGHRTYQINVTAPLGQFNQPAVDAFFASLKIQPAPPIPAQPFEFLSPDGRFSVTTPVPLGEIPLKRDTTATPIALHLFLGGEGGPLYQVIYRDMVANASQDPEVTLDKLRDRLLAVSKATLLSERKISASSGPARELIFTYMEVGHLTTARSRIFLAPGRYYQAQVSIAGSSPSPESATFFDSFKILPPAP